MESKQNIHPPIFVYYLPVSKLSRVEVCPKRAKIEIFKTPKIVTTTDTNQGSIAIGNRLHALYSYFQKGFDRERLRRRLYLLSDKGKYKKQLDNIMVVGVYDDLRIIRDVATGKKYTVLVEVKTTTMKYMWSREILSGIKQLQLYMWLLKDNLEYLGYPLWKRSYLQIYSQKGGKLMNMIPVEYDDKIEEWIKGVVEGFKGLRPVSVPPFAYCKRCPVSVKRLCDWYMLRKEYYAKTLHTI